MKAGRLQIKIAGGTNMLRLIVGEKGSGKTRKMVDMMNNAVGKTPGKMVCIEKSQKLMFDLNHAIRLMDTESYKIDSFKNLYGFVQGVLASDYDIHEIFIDDIFKICGTDMETFAVFIEKLLCVNKDREISYTINATCNEKDLPEKLKEFLV